MSLAFSSQFWRKPARLKAQALRYHFKTRIWSRTVPWIPLPVRLPFGGWWLAYDDVHSDGVFAGFQEGPDIAFARSYLQPGMTAMDIGANNGYYTLLMARRVETKGQVIAFEPSPREFQRLRRHIWMNRCTNVLAEQLGVADRCGSRALFVVNGIWPARNSLRPAKALNPLPVDVNTTTVDAYLSRHSEITRIDFIKLDVEGAELEVLEGAQGLLSGHSHPVILCELNDPVITECGWQHRAADVVQFLEKLGYAWFGIDKEGCLCQPPRRDWICGDFVFMPHGAPEPGQATALERSCAL